MTHSYDLVAKSKQEKAPQSWAFLMLVGLIIPIFHLVDDIELNIADPAATHQIVQNHRSLTTNFVSDNPLT